MNYEQKYKKALKWMQGLYSGLHGATKEEAEKYFPELKENEDEIRKDIISFLKDFEKDHYRSVNFNSWIAWLEKQGEKKPTDEVEPKFKVGDWVVGDEGTFKITRHEDERGYELTGTTGYVAHFISPDYVESKFNLWTIEDAKDGDVLINWNNTTFIFKAIEDETAKYHIAYNENWDTVKTPSTKSSHLGLIEPQFEFHPATKEQRDLLFQKMKEAGYEWDADKRELKKIEVASKESEDERIREALIDYLKKHYEGSTIGYGVQVKEALDWLKKKKKLSSYERGRIDDIILALRTLGNEKLISYTEEINFLLKIRNW